MMYVKHHFVAALAGLFLLGGAFLGCEREPAPRKVVQPTPEESFAQIAELFSQAVETGPGGMPGGFISSEEGGGHSRLLISNKVTRKLIPPTNATDKYRGVITVTSRYDYALQRPAEEEPSEDRHDKNENTGEIDTGTMDESEASDEGIEILDPDLVIAPEYGGKVPSEPSADLIARRSDQTVSDYELEYENGRWVLKTALDPDTERAIQNAFEHALDLQP